MNPVLAQASELAGVDCAEVLERGGIAGLPERAGQLFTVAYSHATALVHATSGIVPAVLAGYSLGIYAALSASGAISLRDCLALVAAAFDIMKEECKLGSYGVGAVVGLTERETDGILATGIFASICRTNTNNDTCCIFSGASADLDAFLAAADKRGALSTVRLGLSIPYHHPAYLANASHKLLDIAGNLPWRNAETPIVSSIDQTMLFRAADLVRFVAANIASPVNWRKVSETLAVQGMTTAYECGPGISLSQNGRFMDNPMRYVTVKQLVRSGVR